MGTSCHRGSGLASAESRASRRGKNTERLVAKALGGFRPRGGNRGVASSDIGGVPWSVEVTRTKNEYDHNIRKKWTQACVNAKLEGREPVLVYLRPRQRLDEGLVVCRFGLFRQLAGGADDSRGSADPLGGALRETGEEVRPFGQDDGGAVVEEGA